MGVATWVYILWSDLLPPASEDVRVSVPQQVLSSKLQSYLEPLGITFRKRRSQIVNRNEIIFRRATVFHVEMREYIRNRNIYFRVCQATSFGLS